MLRMQYLRRASDCVWIKLKNIIKCGKVSWIYRRYIKKIFKRIIKIACLNIKEKKTNCKSTCIKWINIIDKY